MGRSALFGIADDDGALLDGRVQSRGMTKYEPSAERRGESADVSEMRPASALAESAYCAAWAIGGFVEKQQIRPPRATQQRQGEPRLFAAGEAPETGSNTRSPVKPKLAEMITHPLLIAGGILAAAGVSAGAERHCSAGTSCSIRCWAK